jgi:hypothetical protein
MNIMMGAAAISKLNTPAQAAGAPPIDPAIKAIAKHRQAAADHLAACQATDAAERRSEAFYAAEDHQTECCYRECAAGDALATTVPTTLARAWLPSCSTRMKLRIRAKSGPVLTPPVLRAGTISYDKRWRAPWST